MSETAAMTLTEFLLLRIEEDNVVARGAIGTAVFQSQTGRWVFEKIRDQYGEIPIVFAVADGGGKTQAANLEEAWEGDERGAHIARHNPARVLAECESKRRIVERCSAVDYAMPSTHLAHGILAEMVLPYAKHPDCREEWKP